MNGRSPTVLPCPADLWPPSGRPDHRRIPLVVDPALPCRRQLLGLPVGRYDWLRFDLDTPPEVAGSETAWLYYGHGLDPECLTVRPGEPAWLPVPRRDDLLAVRLPHRPEITVTAVTLILPEAVRRP